MPQILRKFSKSAGRHAFVTTTTSAHLAATVLLKAMATMKREQCKGAWQHVLRNVATVVALRTGDGDEH